MPKLSPDQVFERFESIKTKRITWEDHWQELSDYYLPRKNTITNKQFPGAKRRELLFETTGVQAAETLAGALHGMLTNPTVRWFDLTTKDPDLDRRDDVRQWLQNTSEKMFNVLNQSNFQKAIAEIYLDLVIFGTTCMAMLEDSDRVVHFVPIFIKQIYIDENHKGLVDEVYRSYTWKAKHILQRFEEKDVPEEIKSAFRRNDTTEYEIIHAVYPSTLGTKKAGTDRKYISQYVLVLANKKFELEIKGFREFPFLVPRWLKSPGEIYGRSPAMSALADVKMINKMDEVVIQGAQKTIDPPLQVPDDGYLQPVITVPAGLNFYRSGTQDRIQPILNDARIDFGFQIMEERRKRIRDAFFIDQLQLSQGPQMTATEVLQRTEEKMRLLGPMLGRQQDELLRPMIDRLFDLMIAKEVINKEDIPEILSGRNLDVEYSSLVAKSQKASELQKLLRLVEVVGPIAQAQPEVLDLIDGEEYVRLAVQLNNAQQSLLRTQEEVSQLRQSRQQAQQQSQQLDQAQKVAQIASQAGVTG